MDAKSTCATRQQSSSRVAAKLCIVALTAATALAQAGQNVSTQQGQVQSGGVTGSPWPSGPDPDRPQANESWRTISGSPGSRPGPTPTWDHPPSPSKGPTYKCLVKGQTVFQDTPCAGGQAEQINRRVRAAPSY